MSSELVDVRDENGRANGQVLTRSEVHKQGLWHGVVFVWIYNSHGQILMQQRALDRKAFPGKWDVSVGGHMLAGDDPLRAAVREVSEEVGLLIDPGELKAAGTCTDIVEHQKGYVHRDYQWAFLLQKDLAIDDLKLQAEEVIDAKWVDADELEKALNNKDFETYSNRTRQLYDFVLSATKK